MKHIPLDVTDKQRGNLLYLAEYLDTDVTELPFDMSVFQGIPQGGCGTSACALGHGPLIGIRKVWGEDWVKYSTRAFGVPFETDACVFLFGVMWTTIDNTPRAAAARIYYALEHGIPKNWDYWPNCYTVKPQPRYTIEDLMPRVRARREESVE